jgi:histidinol-phosphate phosphatase family protein
MKIDSTWSLFLDRDGVINERIVGSYVREVSEFHFLPGVQEAIRIFSGHFAHIFVVTNQQGIGKGYMTERNLDEVHRYMRMEIEHTGGRLTAIYHAPQLASANHPDRKPGIGMGLRARNEYPTVDFSKSILVGDSDSDIIFGKNLGMVTVKIGEEGNAEPDFVVSGLPECIQLFEL